MDSLKIPAFLEIELRAVFIYLRCDFYFQVREDGFESIQLRFEVSECGVDLGEVALTGDPFNLLGCRKGRRRSEIGDRSLEGVGGIGGGWRIAMRDCVSEGRQ